MESLIYLLKSTAILSLFLLVYEFFLKKETHFLSNRIFLLFGILTAAVLPFFKFEKIIYVIKSIEPTSAQEVTTTNLGSFEKLHIQPQILPQEPGFWESLNYMQILLGIYLIVASFFLLKFLFSLWQLRNFLKIQSNYSFKNGIKYIRTDEKTSAFSFFKNIVYNPALHNSSELDLILKHEEAHVKQYHSADMLLGNLLVFIIWFNPLVWLYRKRISQNLEFLADKAATQDLNYPKAYQLSLLNYLKVDSSVLPVNNFHKSFIKTRIKKIQQRKSKKYASLKIGLILPLLTAFFFIFQIDSRAEIYSVEMDLSTPTSEKIVISKKEINSIYLEQNTGVETKEILETNTQTTESTEVNTPIETKIKKELILNSEKQITHGENDNFSKVMIHKSSTEASLKKIKKLLKKMNKIEFNYSNLRFDNEKNLTQIEMSFIDQNGKDYHYSIIGNNPIPEIQLVVSKDFTGFKTFTKNDHSKSINRASAIIINGKPSGDFEEELGEILYTAKKRAENKDDIIEHKPETLELIKSINIIKGEDASLIIINDQAQLDSIIQAREKEIVEQKVNYIKRIFTIDKNTPDKELEGIKNFFTQQNINLSYLVAKRNKKGEITKIKIEVKDKNGNSSSTAYQNNKGISSFELGLKDEEFFID